MVAFIRVILLCCISVFTIRANSTVDSLLIELDQTIQCSEQYNASKQARINALMLKCSRVDIHSADYYNVYFALYQEYKPYICDSAIYYLNICINIAKEQQNQYNEYSNIITLSYLMGSAGMYKEAVDMIEAIDRNKLSPALLVNYYDTYSHIYGELAFYTQNKEISGSYRKISDQYKDSLNTILPADSDLKMILDETYNRYIRNFPEAYRINDIRLEKVSLNTPEHALVTYHRSLTCQFEGNVEEQKRYLALSALSDIHSAIKDHASLWMLAEILYSEGDIERAYEYIRFSWNETVFYNARLRSLQSAFILSLIDKTYQAMIEKQNRKLQTSLIVICALFPMLILALLYIYKQMKRLSVARKHLQVANNQLKKLNEDLKLMNIQLKSTNLDLTESNQIKEEYIGRFIKLCSLYIDKLDGYRRMVHKKVSNGKITEVLSMTSSQDMLENELKELYVNFDTAFLQLFPGFVGQVNGLLLENDLIVLKKGELLNTELRILALIRLGIDDSSQIAEFLRYSVNTIYNYRAKIKSKARGSRDNFEDRVMTIR